MLEHTRNNSFLKGIAISVAFYLTLLPGPSGAQSESVRNGEQCTNIFECINELRPGEVFGVTVGQEKNRTFYVPSSFLARSTHSDRAHKLQIVIQTKGASDLLQYSIIISKKDINDQSTFIKSDGKQVPLSDDFIDKSYVDSGIKILEAAEGDNFPYMFSIPGAVEKGKGRMVLNLPLNSEYFQMGDNYIFVVAVAPGAGGKDPFRHPCQDSNNDRNCVVSAKVEIKKIDIGLKIKYENYYNIENRSSDDGPLRIDAYSSEPAQSVLFFRSDSNLDNIHVGTIRPCSLLTVGSEQEECEAGLVYLRDNQWAAFMPKYDDKIVIASDDVTLQNEIHVEGWLQSIYSGNTNDIQETNIIEAVINKVRQAQSPQAPAVNEYTGPADDKIPSEAKSDCSVIVGSRVPLGRDEIYAFQDGDSLDVTSINVRYGELSSPAKIAGISKSSSFTIVARDTRKTMLHEYRFKAECLDEENGYFLWFQRNGTSPRIKLRKPDGSTTIFLEDIEVQFRKYTPGDPVVADWQ